MHDHAALSQPTFPELDPGGGAGGALAAEIRRGSGLMDRLMDGRYPVKNSETQSPATASGLLSPWEPHGCVAMEVTG